MEELIDLGIKQIESECLTVSKAKQVLEAVTSSDFCKLISCHKEASDDVIVFDAEIEVGQYPKNDIHHIERIAVRLTEQDDSYPKIYALRKDFPVVPHLNQEYSEFPRSICLYAQPYDEVKMAWTGYSFIEEIRNWLRRSAKGELHQPDQPLEPFLYQVDGNLIVSGGLNPGDRLEVTRVGKQDKLNLVAQKTRGNSNSEYLLDVLLGEPQLHGIITKKPENAIDLHNFLLKADLDFKDYLLKSLTSMYHSNSTKIKQVFLVILPKKRNRSDEGMSFEFSAFLMTNSVEEAGIYLGLWSKVGGRLGLILNPQSKDSDFENIKLQTLRILQPYNRELANHISGYNATIGAVTSITAIGMGALGSQILMNCIRMGYGKWTIIDDDDIYPHNLGRHDLNFEDIFYPKVEGLAKKANSILNEQAVQPIVANIIKDFQKIEIQESLLNTDLIIDSTASLSAGRKLGHSDSIQKRIVSIFLNPSGTNMVTIAEDQEKQFRLNHVEAQYYRAIINEKSLFDHSKDDNKVRYSTSCRDVSGTIPQHALALFSGIASEFVINLGPEADLSIWVHDSKSYEVKRISPGIFKTTTLEIGEWHLVVDDWIIEKINRARTSRLPNETGGILIGYHDLTSKTIYLVDSILSPNDSIEYPTAYIRGIEGVGNSLDEISKRSFNIVRYIGEWHSHPSGHDVQPSGEDQVLFTWLRTEMNKQGLPAMLMIVGDDDFGIYIE